MEKKNLLGLCIMAGLALLLSSCAEKGIDTGKDSQMQQERTEWPFVLGVNRTELHEISDETAQLAVLDAIKASGAESVRITITGQQEDKALRHIAYCREIGLKVLLMVKLGEIAEIYPEGTQRRSGEGRFWNVYPHSKIDVAKYREYIEYHLSRIRDNGCSIDVIEVGNEVAWCDFNGDFPVYETGKGIIYKESSAWADIPESVRNGVRKVGQLSATTKEVAGDVFGENCPKVILGGLNDEYDYSWLIRNGGTLMPPAVALKIIKGEYEGMEGNAENYLSPLDGISIHFYPSDNCPYREKHSVMVYEAGAYLKHMMAPIIKETDKAVYLSEIGYPVTTYGAADDFKRTAQFKALFEAIANSDETYKWEQVHVYSWDQMDYRLTANGENLHSADNIFKLLN